MLDVEVLAAGFDNVRVDFLQFGSSDEYVTRL
jgi:hypothetical protein